MPPRPPPPSRTSAGWWSRDRGAGRGLPPPARLLQVPRTPTTSRITFAGKQLGIEQPAFTGFDTPPNVLRADQVFVRGVRLPYQKFNRQPLEP